MPRCVRTAHVFEKKWRSDDVRLQEEASFSSLLLPDKILKGLENAGYKTPSPIQLESIPVGRFGRDLLVQAKSGTGKTLVFTVIALENLTAVKYPQVLIIAPTREIALQICDVVRAVGSAFKGLTCNCFIGGMPVDNDVERVHGCQIIVGTPGRLKHLLSLGILPANSIRLLVLDEADVLLESNFKDDLDFIFVSLPKEKQVIATSATYPKELRSLTCQYFRKAYLARLNRNELTLLGMVHYIQVLELSKMSLMAYKTKLEALEKVLTSVDFTQCLVFCNLITRVEPLSYDVKNWGFACTFISSAKEQCDRIKAIDCLKHFKCKVLVTSDVTSRGIDAENVDLVVNFDKPVNSDVYFHRCGRAGRYGAKGVAITFLDKIEVVAFEQMKVKHNFKAYNLPDLIPANLINIRPNDSDSSTEDSEGIENSSEEFEEKDSDHMNGYSSDKSGNLKEKNIRADSSKSYNAKVSSNLNGHTIKKKDKDTNLESSALSEFNTANEKVDCTVNKESSVSDSMQQSSISEVVTRNGDNQIISEINVTELAKDNSFLEYLESGSKDIRSSPCNAKGSDSVVVSNDNISSQELKSKTTFEANDTQNNSEKQCMNDNIKNALEVDNNGTDSKASKHNVSEYEIIDKVIPSSDTLESITQEKNTSSIDTPTSTLSNTPELDKVHNEGLNETKAVLIPNEIHISVGKFLMKCMNNDVNNSPEIDISPFYEDCSDNKTETEQDLTKTFKDIRGGLTDFYSKVFQAYEAENLTDAAFENVNNLVMQQKESAKENVNHSNTALSHKIINCDEKITKNIHDELNKENDKNSSDLKSSDVNVCDISLYSEVPNESILSEKNKASGFGQVFERYVFKENSADTSSSSSDSDEDPFLTLERAFHAAKTSEKAKSKTTLNASQKGEKEKYINMKKKKFPLAAGKEQHSSTLYSGESSDSSTVSSSDEDTETMLQEAGGAKKMYSGRQNFKCESKKFHLAKQKRKFEAKPCNAKRISDKFNETLTESSEVSESESLTSSQSVHNTSTPYFKGLKSANRGQRHAANYRNLPFPSHHYGNVSFMSQPQEHSTSTVNYGNIASTSQPQEHSTSTVNYGNIASTSQPHEHNDCRVNYGNFPAMNCHQERQLPSYACNHQINGHASHNYRPNQENTPHISHESHHQLRNVCCQNCSADWYQMYVKQWQFIHSSLF